MVFMWRNISDFSDNSGLNMATACAYSLQQLIIAGIGELDDHTLAQI